MEKYLQILSRNIKTLAKEFQLSQTDFLEECGVTRSFVSNMKKSMPTIDKILNIAKYTNYSIDYLLGLSDVKDIITSENLKQNIPEEYKHIFTQYRNLTPNNKSIVDYIFGMEEEEAEPVHQQLSDNTVHLLDMGELIAIDTYTEKVSAGNGNTTVTGYKVSKLYPTSKIASKATYAAIITGDSMEPRFIDNDIIYVNDNKIPGHDDIGVFTYNGETYCKKYYVIDGVEKLISLNDSYSPIIIDKTLQFEKQGVVIGKFHAD